METLEMSLKDIVVRKQVRTDFNEESIKELASSIKSTGLLQPLSVRKVNVDGDIYYKLIDGERRYRALELLGKKKSQVHVIGSKNDLEDLIKQIIANCQREDLKPMELAEGYKKLKTEFGFSNYELANRVGKGEAHVRKALELLNLSSDLKEKVANGVPVSKVLEASKITDETKKQEVLKNIDNYSRGQIRAIKNPESSDFLRSGYAKSHISDNSSPDLKIEESSENDDIVIFAEPKLITYKDYETGEEITEKVFDTDETGNTVDDEGRIIDDDGFAIPTEEDLRILRDVPTPAAAAPEQSEGNGVRAEINAENWVSEFNESHESQISANAGSVMIIGNTEEIIRCLSNAVPCLK